MLDFASFFYDYSDFQYLEVDPVPFNYGTANVPTVHIYGLEGEGGYTSRDRRLKVNGTFALENGFAEGRYTTLDSSVVNGIEATAAPCQGNQVFFNPACFAAVEASAIPIRGKTPPDLPRVSGSLNASYALDAPGGVLTPNVEFIYRGEEAARIFNDPALDRIGSYGVWNFNLQYAPARRPFKLSLAVINAFGRDGVNSRFTDPFGTVQTSQQYIAPRQMIGTLAAAF